MAHQLAHAQAGLAHDDHGHGEIKDEDLPALDENFLKLLGDFKDVEDFKTKIKENILTEKEIKEKDKKRADILEGIIKDSKGLSIPYNFYNGALKVTENPSAEAQKSNESLQRFAAYLEQLQQD
jgi:FKBP-type peptidyl-prolyl cis-trans isomerase (trigger factor)